MGGLGGTWGPQGVPRARTRDGGHTGGPRPPGPHLLGAAWPNKPSVFGVTFDAIPTGSHTSPNPAKICAKLNQSILEMALVRFCRGRRDQEGPSARGGWGFGSEHLRASHSLWGRGWPAPALPLVPSLSRARFTAGSTGQVGQRCPVGSGPSLQPAIVLP